MGDLEKSVRDSISFYVGGAFTVEDLAQALPDGWDLDEAGDSVVADLVLRTMGMIAEVQAGDLTDPELRKELENEVSWKLTSESDSITQTLDQSVQLVTQPSVGAGTRPLTGSLS